MQVRSMVLVTLFALAGAASAGEPPAASPGLIALAGAASAGEPPAASPELIALAGAVSAGEPPAASPELIAKGKTVYNTYCLSCHGEKGDGNGPAGAALNPKPRDLRSAELEPGKHFKNGGSPEQLFNSITVGMPGTLMMAFSNIPEADRWAIVRYIEGELRTKAK